MFEAVRHPAESDTCCMIEIVEAIVSSQSGLINPLEASLVQSDSEKLGEEVEEYVKWMDSFEYNRRKYYEPLGKILKHQCRPLNNHPRWSKSHYLAI